MNSHDSHDSHSHFHIRLLKPPFPWPLVITWLIIMAGCGLFGVWAYDREPPTEFKSWVVLTPRVPPGGVLRVKWRIYRHRNDCQFKREELIIDGAGTRWTTITADLGAQPGALGDSDLITPTVIPVQALPGDALHRVVVYYACNTLQLVWPVVDRLPDRSFLIEAVKPDELVPDVPTPTPPAPQNP